MAICRYFEETKPEPALFGKGAKQRAHGRDVEPAHGAGAAGLRRPGVPPPASGRGPARGAAGAGLGRGQQAQGAGDPAVSWTRSWASGASSPATTIRSPTSPRWWRSTSPSRPGWSGRRASRTSRAGIRRSRPGRARRPERSGCRRSGRSLFPREQTSLGRLCPRLRDDVLACEKTCHETDGCRLRRRVRLGRPPADLLPRRGRRHALPHRLRRHHADRLQQARHRSQHHRDDLHLASARRSFRRPGVVAGPRPACRQAHRPPHGRRPGGRARRASRPRRRRCFRARRASSAATTCASWN